MQPHQKKKFSILIRKNKKNHFDGIQKYQSAICIALLLLTSVNLPFQSSQTFLEKEVIEQDSINFEKNVSEEQFHPIIKHRSSFFLGNTGYETAYFYVGGIINSANGNLYLNKKDVSFQARGYILELSRSYNSFNNQSRTGFGYGWTFNYNIYLIDKGEYILWIDGDGSVHNFASIGGGDYTSPPGIPARLKKNIDNTYTLWFHNGVKYYFNPVGLIQTIGEKNGNNLTFVYTKNKLIKIIDDSGLSINISYNSRNLIDSIQDPLGRVITYSYDNYDNLINVTDATGSSTKYRYYCCHKLANVIDKTNVNIIFYYYENTSMVREVRNSVYKEMSQLFSNPFMVYLLAYQNETTYFLNARNYASAIKHNHLGNPLEIIDSFDNSIYLEWNNNSIVSLKDKNGNLYQYTYDNYRNIIAEIDPLGYETYYGWTTTDTSDTYHTLLSNISKVAYEPTKNKIKIFNDTFNPLNPIPGWIASAFWLQAPGPSHSPPESYGCGFGWYGQGWHETLQTPFFNLSNYTNAEFTFWHMRDFDGDPTVGYMPDGGNVKISTDGGQTWTLIHPKGGYNGKLTYGQGNPMEVEYAFGYSTLGTWIQERYDLTAYVGLTSNVSIRFEMGTDINPSPLNQGWFIDDVLITGYNPSRRKITTLFDYDEKGNLIKITDPLGNNTFFSYDEYGNLLNSTDFQGYETHLEYDNHGNNIKIIDATGNTSNLKYDVVGRLLNFTDANGHSTQYFYDNNDRITKIIDATGNETTYFYNPSGALIRMIDANGHQTNYTHNAVGGIEQVDDPTGNATHYIYNRNGGIIKSTDPKGNSTSIQYDPLDRPIAITDALGNTERFGYDANGNIIWMMDKKYSVTNYEYDKMNRITRVIDPQNGEIVYTYDEFGNLINKTDENRHYTINKYDDLNRRISCIRGLPGVFSEEKFFYDANSNLIRVVDANNHTQTFEYDSLNRIIKYIDPRGNYSTYIYDAVGNIKSEQDRNGHITSYEYDPLNQIRKITDPNDNVTQFSYDAIGNLKTTTNQKGYTTTFSYDKLHRLINLTDPTGNSTKYRYDSAGNLIAIIEPNGASTQYTYDQLGRVKKTTSPLGFDTIYTYDAVGNIIQITDPNNNITQYTYDTLNRLTSIGNPTEGNYLYLFYDKKGNMISAQDANGKITTYTYDDFDRLIETTSPLSYTTKYLYDNKTNVIQRTDANLAVTNYSYDELDRLIQINYPTGYVQYNYDAVGNIVHASNNNIGLDETFDFAFDDLNRRISVKVNYQLFTKMINYTYDAVGNIKTLTDPNGNTISYNYNPVNKVTKITDQNNNETLFKYNEVRKLIQTIYPNGVYTNYSWNAGKNIVNITTKKSNHQVLSSYAYTYDKAGNRISMKDQYGGITIYNYDNIYRLKKTTYPSGKIVQYTYDKVDNRLTKTINYTTIITYQYDAENRLISDGTFTYSFDNNGNMIGKTDGIDALNYTYDFEDRLTQVILPDLSTVNYSYSPFWHRMSRINGNDITYFIYDHEDILMEFDNNGDTQAEYIHGEGIDEPISMKRSNTKAFYHFDVLGSITKITDMTENILNTYTYDDFGNIINQNESLKNIYKYTGRVFDENVSLYYNRLRYYDPEIGRFLTKDPLGMVNGANLYMYVHNNPINFVDPWGEQQRPTGISEHGTVWDRYFNDPEYRKCIDDAWDKYEAKLKGKIQPLLEDSAVSKARQDRIRELNEIIEELEELSRELHRLNRNAAIRIVSQYVIAAVATVVTLPMGGWGGAVTSAAINAGGSAAVGAITDATPQEQFVNTLGSGLGGLASSGASSAGSQAGSIAADVGIGTATNMASDAVSSQPQTSLADVIAEYGGTNPHWIRTLAENGCNGALSGYVDAAIRNLKKERDQLEAEGQRAADAEDAQTRPILDWAKKERDADIKNCNVVITPSPSPTPPKTPKPPQEPPKEEPPKPQPPKVTGTSVDVDDSPPGSTGSSQGGGVVTEPGYTPYEPGDPKVPSPRTIPECNYTMELEVECTWDDTTGMPPGSGGDFGFLPPPPSYCIYRVIYFGSRIIDNLGENHKVLYNAIKWGARHSKLQFTKVLIMPSWGGYDGGWIKWQNFADNHSDIILLNWSDSSNERETITYSGLKNLNPDVLVDSDHYSATEQGGYYTNNEINAIQKYLLDEHAYIATYGTLGDNPGQNDQTTRLLALLGLNTTEGQPHKYSNNNPWLLDSPGHPIFFNVSMTNWPNAGDVTGNIDIGLCPLCGEKHLGSKLAHLDSTEGNHHTLISAYELWYAPLSNGGLISQAGGECIVVPQTVYFGNRIVDDIGNNYDALYNAIKWAAEQDNTEETNILIMPGWGGYNGWSQWQTFANNYPDLNLSRWSNNSASRPAVTIHGLEATNADVIIDSNHSSPTQQGGFYTTGELQAIEWYVKTRGHGYIVTYGSLGNHTEQINQTAKLMELLSINKTTEIGNYNNNREWVIDSPYHPIIYGVNTWNPGNVTANLDVENADKIAHLYSSQGNHYSIISAYEGFGNGTCICECNIPPIADFTVEPSSPQVFDTIYFNSTSFDIDGVIINYTWDFDDGNYSFTTNTIHSYQNAGTYFVSLIVTDDNNESDQAFHELTILGNNPPNTPSNPNPINGAINVPVTSNLSWTGGDPDNDTVSYDVYFGVQSPPPKVSSNQSTTTYNPGTMLYNSQYYWQIIAWDAHGAKTNGPPWDFQTEQQPNNPPYTPYNPFPTDGMIDVTIDVSLSWSGGDPDPGDTVTYDVYFGTSTSPQKVTSNQSTLTYNPGTLNYITTYYWKIVAWDNHNARAIGPIWSFTTIEMPNNPPNPPNNPQPTNGATDVSINSDLSWDCTDPDGDPLTYDVYFDTSTPPILVSSNQTENTYNPGTMAYDTTYYWQIVAWDDHAASTAGPIWSFTTESYINNPPNPPEIDGPTSGIAGETYDYKFQTDDPENDNVWYYVEWGDDTSSGWEGPYPSGLEITLSHTWNEKGTYTIRAKAKDTSYAESGWETLDVTMPVSKSLPGNPFFQFLRLLLDRLQFAFPILKQILEHL